MRRGTGPTHRRKISSGRNLHQAEVGTISLSSQTTLDIDGL